MNLEELKSAWQVFDKKIQSTQAINEKLIESMIRERSMSRVSAIKRQYHFFLVMLIVEVIVLISILLGNPFDFKYQLQFVPYVLITVGVIVAFFNILKLYRKLDGPVSNFSIGDFLKTIIETYDKNKVFEKWFGVILMSIGFIIPLSFLPKKIANKGIALAVLETAILMAVTLLLYFIAFKLGAFRNRQKEKLIDDLAELNELKAMSKELNENGNSWYWWKR